jgi:hypothetical protein
MVAYTQTEMKEVSEMPGSQALQTWQNVTSVNGPNFAEASRGSFVVPSQLIGFASWTVPSLNGNTTFSLYYRGRSTTGTSFVFHNDFNGDGVNRDLIWIPKTRDCLKFVDNAHRDAFWNFVNNDRYLSKNKGSYAEPFAARAPWTHTFDFRVVRQFHINAGSRTHRLELSADIFNVGNLINSKWGVGYRQIDAISSTGGAGVLDFLAADQGADNVPVFRMRTDASTESGFVEKAFERNLSSWAMLWRMQIGVRYTF